MSDRRRYEYLVNTLGRMVLRPGDGSVWSTTGHYYHESAVRELVKALRSDHAEHTKGNFPSVCQVCRLLTHYKELLDE